MMESPGFASPMLDLATLGRINVEREKLLESNCSVTNLVPLAEMKTPLAAEEPLSPFDTVGRVSFLSAAPLPCGDQSETAMTAVMAS